MTAPLDVADIRATIGRALENVIVDLNVYAFAPDNPQTPAAVVYPVDWEYHDTYESDAPRFVVQLLDALVQNEYGQVRIDGWISRGVGTSVSCVDAIEAIGSLMVTELRNYGQVQLADGGTRLLSAELVVLHYT
jgi:uncharacterized protein YidB (DUF937 family)